jgi:hypothetical protein
MEAQWFSIVSSDVGISTGKTSSTKPVEALTEMKLPEGKEWKLLLLNCLNMGRENSCNG